MATATAKKVNKVSAASVFRRLNALKNPPSDEKFIETVRKESGSKTFDAKHLAWYRSMAKQGKLSEGRSKSASN